MLLLMAPVGLFAAGAGAFVLLRGEPPAEPESNTGRSERSERPVTGKGRAVSTPVASAPTESKSASSLASPMVGVLRRLKELDADPKLSSEGSELIGSLRELSRPTDAGDWPGVRARVVTWIDAVRASPQGADPQLGEQLGRVDTALEAAL